MLLTTTKNTIRTGQNYSCRK